MVKLRIKTFCLFILVLLGNGFSIALNAQIVSTEQKKSLKVAIRDADEIVAREAVQRIDNQEFLSQVALQARTMVARKEAVEKLNNHSLLKKVIFYSLEEEITKSAFLKLTNITDQTFIGGVVRDEVAKWGPFQIFSHNNEYMLYVLTDTAIIATVVKSAIQELRTYIFSVITTRNQEIHLPASLLLKFFPDSALLKGIDHTTIESIDGKAIHNFNGLPQVIKSGIHKLKIGYSSVGSSQNNDKRITTTGGSVEITIDAAAGHFYLIKPEIKGVNWNPFIVDRVY